MQIIGSQLLLLVMQTIKFNDENMLIVVVRPIDDARFLFIRRTIFVWTIYWIIAFLFGLVRFEFLA